ncbi:MULTISPECIES: diguanylate cyclase domain-containing protein [Pseudomonas]|uniref:TackOD1 domain-containing metal-binding protein n=1 Tax=Pseudomonas TaxID=286 RepID=UPI000F01F82B|nr:MULTISPECIES: diguanylate cyclase [Pseudomonas]MBD8615443.1 diguanylate cyclase [Pseudomonas putida]MBD8681904.1 diguanylate cyclase [Pseudomonas sp. CFBP 13719]
MNQPKVAFVRKSAPSSRQDGLFAHFPDAQALLKDPVDFDIVILDQTAELTGLFLRLLRVSPRYRFKLIYARDQSNALNTSLSDGLPPENFFLISQAWSAVTERLDAFNRGSQPESFETRILAYLWMREGSTLRAVGNNKLNQHYHYPLLDALMGSEKAHAFTWLSLMEGKGLLEPAGIVDRIRMCKGCGSSRLNYVDVCPECNCLDIKRQPAIHCFTCGHINHQDKFLVGGVMNCPKCLTRLRHIGSDYDRPMENYSCNGCHAFFVDAKVDARCLDCGECHEPSELRMQLVQDYTLTEKGRMLCRNGLLFEQTLNEKFVRGNFVSFDQFKNLLVWQMQMVKRYPEFCFTLLGVHMHNLEAVMGELGVIKGNAFAQNLVERISANLRETDRASRSQDDHLWVLLPHTDAKGASKVEPRLQEIQKLLSTASAQVKMSVASVSIQQGHKLDDEPEGLLAHLRDQLGAA